MAHHDVVVVGSGPAGWATAVACAEAGLGTALLAPQPLAPWSARYGTWVDELDHLGYGEFFEAQWQAVTVVGERTRTVPRAYGRVDSDALRRHLIGRGEQAGIDVVVGTAAGARHDHAGSLLLTSDGSTLATRIVVDASGGASSLVGGRGTAAAWQTAYGVIATPSAPLNETGCVLMDFSGPIGDQVPTFLYAQDIGDRRWFLEETVLASRRAVPPEQLRPQLFTRMASAGIDLTDVVEAETVRIPMGLRLPRVQRVIGVGVAGGAVHPATGYSLVTSLRAAPLLARALVEGFQRRATADAMSEAGWAALWPPRRRRARALQEYGLDVMLRMDRTRMQQFFDQFFSLDDDEQDIYLGSTSSARDIAGVMSHVWRGAPPALKRSLAAGDPRMVTRLFS